MQEDKFGRDTRERKKKKIILFVTEVSDTRTIEKGEEYWLLDFGLD